MGKIFKVLQREYLVFVRTKGFIIGTLLVPIIMIGFVALPIIFTQVKSEKQKKISVIDETDMIYNEFVNIMSDTLSDGRKKYANIDITNNTAHIKSVSYVRNYSSLQ